MLISQGLAWQWDSHLVLLYRYAIAEHFVAQIIDISQVGECALCSGVSTTVEDSVHISVNILHLGEQAVPLTPCLGVAVPLLLEVAQVLCNRCSSWYSRNPDV